MSNHLHILVEVPQRPEAALLPDDVELVAKVRYFNFRQSRVAVFG